VLVYDYPAQVAALAAVHADNPLFAQRFEIYWKGMELCNGAVGTAPISKRSMPDTKQNRNSGNGKGSRPTLVRKSCVRPSSQVCPTAAASPWD
jgi:lysyl-tRNA synthetase class 2